MIIGEKMGWKAECVLINRGEQGYFGSFPNHDSDRARTLLVDLGYGKVRSVGIKSLDFAIWPVNKGTFGLGVYECGAILSDVSAIYGSVAEGPKPVVDRLLRLYPDARALVMELESTANYFGYALYENGCLVRAYGGNADDGIVVDEGSLQPEERAFFAESLVRDGERIFRRQIRDQVREFRAPAFGETLVFAMTRSFFGVRLDQFAAENLNLEIFRTAFGRWF
jgi:Family of unknown function (DUF6928)